MKSVTHFNLAELYAEAIDYTQRATSAVEARDLATAQQLMDKRKALVRCIQREMHTAPPWGDNAALDAAALNFVKADNFLELLLAHS